MRGFCKRAVLCAVALAMLCLCACGAPARGRPAESAAPAGEYTDPELARAVALGIGAYRADDPTVSFAQFFCMLDRAVELADPTRLEAWQNVPQLKTARRTSLNAARLSQKAEAEMTRSDGMFAALCAAEALGGRYVGHNNAQYDALWEKMGYWESEARRNYKVNELVFEPAYLYETPKVLFNPNDDYEDRWGDAWYYSFGRASLWSNKPLFDYDEASNSMRAEAPFTYTEALLAALRLYDSGHQVAQRWATAEDKAFVEQAEERRRGILHSEAALNVPGRKYYVSNAGSDSNNGLTPETAWATIGKALTVQTPGDGVFFERGGVFRGTLVTQPGIGYSAFGEGAKPVITTSPENGSGEEKWALVDGTGNLWRFYRDMKQCGSIVVNGSTVIQRVCPFWDGEGYIEVLDYTVVGDSMVFGDAFDVKRMLPNNTFFNDVRYPSGMDPARIPMDAEGKLYFRCDEGNPGKVYQSIEFAVPGTHPTTPCVGVIDRDVVVDNLAFLYAANGVNCEYGVRVENAIIQNCEVGFTGGRVSGFCNSDFSGDEGYKIVGRDGDGIMLMGRHVTARNNYVHDTWDHAFVIETMYGTWEEKDKLAAASPDFEFYRDLTIEGNLVERCASLVLVVDWTVLDSAYERLAALNEFRDIVIKDNYSINNGFNWRTGSALGKEASNRGGMGFGHPVGSGGITAENNTVYRVNAQSEFTCVALFSCPQAETPAFRGNTLVQDNYAPLAFQAPGTTALENAVIVLSNGVCGEKPPEQSVRELLGDQTARVFPLSEPPTLLRFFDERGAGEEYALPMLGVNSITEVFYKTLSGEATASVSPDGVVTALQPGTAEIEVTFHNGVNEDIVQIYTLSVSR